MTITMAPEQSPKPRFANNLRVLRRKAGLKQSQLADKLGKSRTTITVWEDPDEPSMPNEVDLIRLAEELSVSARDLRYAEFSSDGLLREAPAFPFGVMEPRYRGRDLPRRAEVVAKRFELDALENLGASPQEMGVIRATMYSPETILMFEGGYEGDAPMTDDEQVVEMEALTEKLRAWLKERVRRRAQSTKRKR